MAAPAGGGGVGAPAVSVPRCRRPPSEKGSEEPGPVPAAGPPHAALTLERRRRIEELSRASRQRLLQSRDRMFSKFTSILQHAVEAVRPPASPATQRRGSERGLAAGWADTGMAGAGGPGSVQPGSVQPSSAQPGSAPSLLPCRGPAAPGSPLPQGREAEAELPGHGGAGPAPAQGSEPRRVPGGFLGGPWGGLWGAAGCVLPGPCVPVITRQALGCNRVFQRSKIKGGKFRKLLGIVLLLVVLSWPVNQLRCFCAV